jgi:hypothetical protein
MLADDTVHLPFKLWARRSQRTDFAKTSPDSEFASEKRLLKAGRRRDGEPER